MGTPPGEVTEPSSDEGEGWIAKASNNAWASLGILVGLWFVLFWVVFLLFAFITQSPSLAFVGGLVGGLAGAVAIGYKFGLAQRVDHARRGAPLWARLFLPLPLFVFSLLLLTVVLGPILADFVLLFLSVSLGSIAVTAAAVKLIGLWDDVPQRVRDSGRTSRLVGLVVVGVLIGLFASLVVLMVLEEAVLALAAFLPATIAGTLLSALVTKWGPEAKAAVREVHWGYRVGTAAIALILVTYYFALLTGPFIPNATLTYAAAAAIALVLLVPATIWARTWRDLWASFVSLGEGNRVLAVLPILPIAVALVFLAIVVLTSMFELAYIVSLPAGLVIFLLAGLPFGITQDIPKVVRKESLPRRVAIFVGAFLLLALYAYFAIALIINLVGADLLLANQVEVALIGGMVFAGLVLSLCIRLFGMGEGLGEEFESYGARGEALVLGLTFIAALVVSFIVIALATGDFRIAFLASVLVAAGVNFLIAHVTALIDGMREAFDDLTWWQELTFMVGLFFVAFLYGTMGVGVFVTNVPIALTGGVLFAALAAFLVARDLDLGEVVIERADVDATPRAVLLALTFLTGFLLGLYVAAAALSVAGNDLFGLPFFVGLAAGTGLAIGVARWRGWDEGVLDRARSGKDRVKVAGILALWLALGVFTGFALQSVPVSGEAIGIGDGVGLPLTLTLAVGLMLWIWLPIVLFRVVAVERTPVRATTRLGEKPKFIASLGWGLLTFVVVAVILLSILDSPVLGLAAAIVVGYLVALAMTTLRGGRATGPDEAPEVEAHP